MIRGSFGPGKRGGWRALLQLRRNTASASPAIGGPVDMGAIATMGASTLAAALVAVGVLSVATTGRSSEAVVLVDVGSLTVQTSGQGTTAVGLRKVGVLSSATSGSGAMNAALRKIGTLSPATTGRATLIAVPIAVRPIATTTSGRSSLSAVLVDVESLTAQTSGRSTMTVGPTSIGVLSVAMGGASSVSVTPTAIGTLAPRTTGASRLGVALDVGGAQGSAAPPVLFGGFSETARRIATHSTRSSMRSRIVQRFAVHGLVAFSGRSVLSVALDVAPRVLGDANRSAADPAVDQTVVRSPMPLDDDSAAIAVALFLFDV